MMQNKSIYHLDWNELEKIGSAHRDSYLLQDPFPYVVLDNLFDYNLVNEARKYFPEETNSCWRDRTIDSPEKMPRKLELLNPSKINELHSSIQTLLGAFISSTFINFLEKVSSQEGLVADPFFIGGGIHMTLSGGFLKPHTDFLLNRHSKLYRVINVILYLNEVEGGDLCLFEGEEQVKRIKPKQNRLVIFNTTDTTVHGHTKVFPNSESRKSISAFFYINKWYAEQEGITAKSRFIL